MSNAPLLPLSNVNVADLTWYIYGFAIVVFIGYSLILAYHWIHYAERSESFKIAVALYCIVSAVLVTVLTLSAYAL
jgi:hypothetical protein